MSLTEESGPSQDIRTQSDFPWSFLGPIAMDMGLRFLHGLKKLEKLDESVNIWGFVKKVDGRVAIDWNEEEEEAIWRLTADLGFGLEEIWGFSRESEQSDKLGYTMDHRSLRGNFRHYPLHLMRLIAPPVEISTVDLLLLLEWMVEIGCSLGNSFGPIRFKTLRFNAWRISPIENGPCLDNSATHQHVFINSGPNLCVSVPFIFG